MKDIQNLTVKEADELVCKNKYLLFEEYEDFTIPLVRKQKNEDNNRWYVEVVRLPKYEKKFGCEPMELEEFCKTYNKTIHLL